MAEIFESVTVTISKRRYDELLKKEFAFDTYKKKIKNDKYLTDIEKVLFVDEEPEVPELFEAMGLDPILTKVEAMVEKEEDDGTETV